MAVVVLAVLGWLLITINERRHEAAEAPLGIVKSWPSVTILGSSRCSIRTVWRAGKIYYQFDLLGYSPSVARAKDQQLQAAFTFTFLDNDGFKLFEHRLPLSETVSSLGADNQRAGLSWKGDEFISEELYQRAAKWELLWSGFPDFSAKMNRPISPAIEQSQLARLRHSTPVDTPKWRKTSHWRSLREEMSEDQVRFVLGEPDKVSTFGSAGRFWYYGYPAGGQVDFDDSGKVSRWTEP